jgi:hypothetical protein
VLAIHVIGGEVAETIPVVGVSGTDATSSKRGYYYQDVLTALAWTKLNIGQELHVELAEDYAVATESEVEVTQIKDVEASLTLMAGVGFLERTLQLMAENPGRELSFVYLTTSSAGLEKNPDHRPAGKSGVLYWQEVQAGAAPGPLVEALKKLARSESRLSEFLASKTETEVEQDLIRRITWAVKSPESPAIKEELKERVAKIANEECGLEFASGRLLWSHILDKVTFTSTESVETQRILTYQELRQLIREISSVTLTKQRYTKLVGEAELAKNPPLAQVNSDIQKRLELLRQIRFLAEANTVERATSLGEDVRDGGVCQIGDQSLRAVALSWCARLLLEERSELAAEFLANADRLAQVQESRLVRALIVAKTDRSEARRLVSGDHSAAAETVRYGIARQGEPGSGPAWIASASIGPFDLDQDGQFLVLWDLLRGERWTEAVDWLEKIPESSYEEFPILLWAGAHAWVAWASADVAKGSALAGPPVVDEIPLRDDVQALAARRRAVEMFKRFSPIAETWGLSATAQLSLEYALWLMLEDRAARPAAIADISRLWRENEGASRWMPLALRAGLDLNTGELASRLDRQATRYGSLSMEDARARLALVLASPAESWIDDWSLIQASISPHFNPAFLQHFYIQGLLQAGRTDAARLALDEDKDLPDLARKRFEIELGKTDEQTISEYRAAVDRDGSPASLHNLVSALVKSGNFSDAAAFALKLYEQTGEHDNAEEYLRLLARSGLWTQILGFLDDHKFLLEQSIVLARMYIDALVRHGRWQEAGDIAREHIQEGDRTELDLYLAISSGHWDEIGRLLENARTNTALTGDELIRFGKVATNLGSIPLAKSFVKRAAEMASDDPSISWNAYMLAVRGQWEDDPQVRTWLAASIASADAEGSPVKSSSLSDLVELAPQWRKKTDALEKSIASGEMFLALAAQQLNRPLATLIVGGAIDNERQRDFRQITPIPAYAGTVRSPCVETPNAVVLDATALLTLARLNLLGSALKLFETVSVAHSVGLWLFTETSRVRFHQPGQIAEAKQLLHAMARNELRVADATLGFSRPLSREVGTDLAQLLNACRSERAAGKDAFVVRSTPLHKVGTLREEDAEVGDERELFRSTLEVMRSLRYHGVVSDHAFDDAMAYLTHVDAGWPDEGLIPRGATLYLDDLAVSYFQHVGAMKWLCNAKHDVVVHPDVQKRAVALSALEETSERVGEVLDEVRRLFVKGQEEGSVKVLPMPSRRQESGRDSDVEIEVTAGVLLSQMFEDVQGADAVVFDDRAANRYPIFAYPGGPSLPMYTTLDVIDWLLEKQHIDEKEWIRSRTELRRSGYLFVPVKAREVLLALESSPFHDGEFHESLAARAIRETHLLSQASGMLRLPDEGPFLAEHGTQLMQAMSTLWSSEESFEVISAKATWIVELSRYDGFADRMLGGDEDQRWVNLDAITILRFLLHLGIQEDKRFAYNQWIEEAFIVHMAQARPRVFEALCDMVRARLLDIPTLIGESGNAPSISQNDQSVAAAMLSKEFVNNLPQSVRELVFEDESLLSKLGLARSSVISVDVDGCPSFSVEDLYAAASVVHRDHAVRSEVVDTSGAAWALSVGESGIVRCQNDGREFEVAHSLLVSPVVDDRVSYARKCAEKVGLAERHISSWISRLSEGPLPANAVSSFDEDFRDSPGFWLRSTERLFRGGKASVNDLVPNSRRYYERLVAPYSSQVTLSEFAPDLERFESPTASMLSRLVWSSHSATSPTSSIVEINANALREAVISELDGLDLWSLVGLVEGIASRFDAFSELTDLSEDVIRKFCLAIESEARLRLTASLVALVDGTLNTSGVLSDVPVFWRRLASISHAALIERAALSSGLDLEKFSEWASSSFPLFQAATLADLQREPRWNGFMLQSSHLKQELLGRVLNVLGPRRSDITDSELLDLIFGESDRSLQSRRVFLLSALAGPLEGAMETTQPLPEGSVELFASMLGDAEQPLHLRVLIASQLASMGSLPEGAIIKLADAVLELDQRDALIDGDDRLLIHSALAAAATGNQKLGSAVKQLVLDQPRVQMALRVYAGVSACAAEHAQDKWSSAVGHVLARCAAMAELRQDAEHILFVLRTMCDARPSLKRVVSRSHARLLGFIGRLE